MNRPDDKPVNALPQDIRAEDIQAVYGPPSMLNGIPDDPADRLGMMGIVLNDCVQSPYPAADPRLDDMGAWKCMCGNINSGNFCTECGSSKSWRCLCGADNFGGFCTECGSPRPWKCPKCGETRFASLCPQCGISIREVTK